MASYTRQSSFSDGDTISSSLFNNEYNQLVTAFSYSSSGTTGHRHDGTAAEGGNIHTIGDQDFLNKIVVDSSNNRWGVYVQVSGATVEQIRFQDGSIVPVTSNDIDLGTSSLQFKDLHIDGTANIDSLTLTSGSTVTVILDEDDLSTNSATALATQQSIKAYVDSQITGQSLSFSGDSGGSLSIDLDSEALTITGGTGIDTTGSTNDMSIAIDSTVATLTGSQTLTNKTLTSPDINGGTIDGATIGGSSAGNITYANLSDGTITITAFADEDDMSSDSATLVPTQQSVKAYVDSKVTAEDLDFQADSGGALSIDLDSETMTFTGGTGIDTSGSGNAVTFAIDSTVTTLAGTQTLTNKTLTTPVITSISNSGTVTLPSGTTTLVGTATSDVLTNKTISGSSNTLSNIGNSSLSNSSVSFGGISVALGSSDATPAFDLSDATGYTGDSSLVTTGTISSGVWQGTAVADTYVANDLTISGGTVNNTVIGGSSPAAADFTTVDTTGNATIGGNLAVTGNLTINGTTSTVNSTTVTIDDPIFTLGGDTAPSTDDNKDRGVEFKWHNGTGAKLGFFGYDDSASVFTFIPDASNTSEVFSGSAGNVAFGAISGTSFASTGNMTFGDSDKAIFGAGNDLQIYHTGSVSVIEDSGTGNLLIRGTDMRLQNAAGSNNYLKAVDGAEVELMYGGATKISTAATGVDVTGSVSADSLEVDDTDDIRLRFLNASTFKGGLQIATTAGDMIATSAVDDLAIRSQSDILFATGGNTERMKIVDTGIDVTGTVTADGLTVAGEIVGNNGTYGTKLTFSNGNQSGIIDTFGNHNLEFRANNDRAMNIAANGDISFYEDTGTTAKLFWDASAERLGIGNSATDVSGTGLDDLVVGDGSAGGGIVIDSGASVDGAYAFASAGAKRGRVRYDNSTDSMHFETNNTGDKLTIDSSGNVGIGTSSPSAGKFSSTPDGVLNISGDKPVVYLTEEDETDSNVWMGLSNEVGIIGNTGDGLAFRTGASTATERMRIDTSGNLLVGKSTTAIETVGINLFATGRVIATADGDDVAVLNRKTSDGDIAVFKKDGSTVGSIGVDNNDNFYIGAAASGHGGFYFGNGNAAPMAAGTRADNTVDLGTSSYRWKALWLKTVDGTTAINTTVSTAINYNAASFTNNAGTEAGRILVNNAGTTQYITSSDQRLKENIADADDAGSKIDAIQVRKFDWKADSSHQDYGMIAQELQVVAPEAVAGDADSEEVMGVDYSKLVPMLVKEIQSLRARVAQLES